MASSPPAQPPPLETAGALPTPCPASASRRAGCDQGSRLDRAQEGGAAEAGQGGLRRQQILGPQALESALLIRRRPARRLCGRACRAVRAGGTSTPHERVASLRGRLKGRWSRTGCTDVLLRVPCVAVCCLEKPCEAARRRVRPAWGQRARLMRVSACAPDRSAVWSASSLCGTSRSPENDSRSCR